MIGSPGPVWLQVARSRTVNKLQVPAAMPRRPARRDICVSSCLFTITLLETMARFDYIDGACAGPDRRASCGGSDLSNPMTAAQAAAPAGARPSAIGAHDDSTLLSAVLASLEDDKAEDIVTIPLAGKSEMADHLVIASGRSSRQVSAIAEKLGDRLKVGLGVIARMEGKDLGDWVLIDAGDVIVHVFRPEVRDFYQLEKMWMPQPPAPSGMA
jgi:ribosome-associated protein